jgi:hypothetical protein
MQPIYLSIGGLFDGLAKSRASPEEWRQAVGRLSIAFGLIEHNVNSAMVILGYEWLYDAVDTLPLERRCRILRGAMQRHSRNERQRSEVEAFFRALDKLREAARNIVAHGAPFLVFEEGMTHALVAPRKSGKRLRIEDVVKAAERAENLDRKLTELTMEIRDNLPDGLRPTAAN